MHKFRTSTRATMDDTEMAFIFWAFNYKFMAGFWRSNRLRKATVK